MKSIPSRVLKDAVVIVPLMWNLTSAVPYLVLPIPFIAFFIVLVMALGHLSIPWPFYLVLVGPVIILMITIGWERGLWRKVILGRDTLKDQVVIVERQLGGTARVVRYALVKVQAVRIYWRALNSSDPDLVYWMATLALSDGKIVPLHSIKGKQDMPPEPWLARFTQASVLLGRPLEMLPLPVDSKPITRQQVVDQLINNIRKR